MPLIKTRDILLAAIPLLLAVAVAFWLSVRDARLILAGPLPEYRTVDVRETVGQFSGAPRRVLDVTLESPDGDRASFTVSLPQSPPRVPDFATVAGQEEVEAAASAVVAPLPVLVLLTGFRSGTDNLARVEAPGANAIVSLDYPYDPAQWAESGFLGRAWIARRTAFALPDHVAAALAWTRRQPWAGKMSIVGVSLGAVALPVIQRRLTAGGLRPAATVFAYGAVDIADLAAANLKLEAPWQRRLAGWVAGFLLGPLEPADHLPHLRGRFLIINGSDDERLPPDTVERLIALTPQPKDVVTLEGAHIDGNRPEVIAETVDVAKAWLVEQEALNP